MDADQVVDDIRSCLISSKGGVPISQINRDYKMIVGQSIPYTKLGYTSLESFLKSIPGLNVYPKGGDLVLEALPTKNTSHITAMVRGQKSSGSRRKVAPPTHGAKNLKGFRTPMPVTSRHGMTEPVGKAKGVTSTQPHHLTSLSRSNFPPRLKSPATSTPPQATTLARLSNAASQRKAQELSFNLEKQPFYPTEGIEHHHVGDGTNVSDPLTGLGSVLRTPTGVLEREPPAPLQDYRRHTSEDLSSMPSLMSITFTPRVIQRTSAQSRISRQVSLPPICLDTDVKMTPVSPNYDHQSPGTQGKQLSGSMAGESNSSMYCNMLQTYCKAKHLPDPLYKIIPSFPKSKTKQIVCSIKVGTDHQFSSYPSECKTEEEAREVAAQDAVGCLEKIYGVLGETLPITTDERLLITRIAQMVHDHPNGLWSLQVPADYRNLHREILPDGWLDVLRTSPLITIDRAVHDRIILLPNRVTTVSPLSPSMKVQATSISSLVSELSVSESTEWRGAKDGEYGSSVANSESPDPKDEEVRNLGQIILPKDEFWNVYVSYATSTSNVWVRLIGEEYSALYDDMAAEMELFYMERGVVANNLRPGHFYAIQVDKCWHRVEIVEFPEESDEKSSRIVNCFFVDNGDEDNIESSKFYVLDAGFTKLPCQAVQCRLTGLEDFSLDVESLLIERIMGRNLVAKPAADSLEDEIEGRPYPSLTLYDTSTDENINLNEVLLQRILDDTSHPSLLKNGKIQEAFVPFIAKTGALFIQLPSSIFNYVTKAISEFSLNITTSGEFASGKIAAGVTTMFEDVMYLARYKEDMLWYRAVRDTNNRGLEDGKVWVKFVDYGNCELTSLKDLVSLPPSHPLYRLPPQAIECRLHNMLSNVNFSEKGLKRCREIVDPEEPVLLRVTSTVTDDTGRTKYEVVEIFKRVQPDNLLASVSTTLSVEEGAFEDVTEDEESQGCESSGLKSPSKPLKSLAKTPCLPLEPGKLRSLPAPKVPHVGELFDVHVTIAANPGNFTVQPWKDAGKFNELMSSIQSVYSSSSSDQCSLAPEVTAIYRKPLQRSQVKEGGVYAALHDDQLWYRISIFKLIEGPSPEEVMVSAYFVDYGDVAVMTLDKLRDLVPEFYNVPYQAVKAKLSGILPVHSDWSVEDCLRFQEMVCNKQFVATVMETGPDLIDPSDFVIGIQLMDTSDPNVDMSIGQILVDEGRAYCTRHSGSPLG